MTTIISPLTKLVVLVLFLTVALVPNGILGIFEDQAGTYDW